MILFYRIKKAFAAQTANKIWNSNKQMNISEGVNKSFF
jgi:hypothetical protein